MSDESVCSVCSRLDRIDTTGGTQMRCRIDDDTVADYRAAMIDGADFPAVVVFAEGKKYWLAAPVHAIEVP